MHLYEGTSPLDQARNRESPRSQPRHGGFCSHRNPDKVSSSDRFFLKFKSQLFIDWNVAPCLIGLPTSSRVSSSPTEEWDTTSSTLDLLRWNFQFSIFNSRYRLINLRPAQVEFSFHCNPIPYFFIPDSPEITLGESFGWIWIKVSVEI